MLNEMDEVKKIETLNIYTDGGSRGNPGPSAIGIVIVCENQNIIHTHKECIGEGTNNQAEYKALIKALQLARTYCTKKVSCVSDSELLVRQLTGVYGIKNEKLRHLFDEIKKLEKAFDEVTYTHVRREHKFIVIADRLVNEALDDGLLMDEFKRQDCIANKMDRLDRLNKPV